MSSTGKRSTIEMLGILSIFGILTISGANIYVTALNKYKTNKFINQINTISSNIRTLYYAKNSYKGLNNYVAINSESIPQEMYKKNNNHKITHIFGGDVIISEANIPISSTSSNAYIIALKGLPRSACITAATTNWNNSDDKKLAALYIAEPDEELTPILNNLEYDFTPNEKLGIAGASSFGAPFTISNAQLACNDSKDNTIVITYI